MSTAILIAGLFVFGVVCYAASMALINAFIWPRLGPGRLDDAGAVSILIPARNEEANLAACLDRALEQGPAVLEVCVYNDHSTDKTGMIIADRAEQDLRIRTVPAQELPEGWCGKPFACWNLAKAARGNWLVFLDADARLERDAIERMVAECRRRELTFLSCWPSLTLGGFWERLLMPMLNFLVFTMFPTHFSLWSNSRAFGLAHGACICVRRGAYFRVGGHEAVWNSIFEDVELARHWREQGERSLCLDGFDVVTVRMYESLEGIWLGFQKNFFPAFRSRVGFALFLILNAACFLTPFVLPPILLLAGQNAAALVFAVSAALILGIRLIQARRFQYSIWSALLHPAAHAIVLALGLSSWWQVAAGHGVTWKGRSYFQRGGPAEPARAPADSPSEDEPSPKTSSKH